MSFAAGSLVPFGAVLTSTDRTPLDSFDGDGLRRLVARARVAVLRGFAVPSGPGLVDFARRLGEPLEWEFGAVNELVAHDQPRNYLYTERAVPFHWDGAFIGRVPSLILFHCVAAPAAGAGGETLFCDTTRLLARAPAADRARWGAATITYTTAKVAHYGGEFSAPMIASHPLAGETVLRYAEPVDDLNPVALRIAGVPAGGHVALIADLAARLRDPAVCYAHAWVEGDLVIADNHALLHGRNAFVAASRRHLRRVNIL